MVKVEKKTAGVVPRGARRVPLPSKSGSTQNMAANVKVVVRVRPMNDRELEKNNRTVVDVVDDRMLVFDPKEEMRPFYYQGVQQPKQGYLKRANKELKFVFDCVCGPEASNHNVFEIATKEMLGFLMEGYNCSVFVYGATGAGKTFTMIGSKENPGITYLTMEHLFYTINSFENDREFDIGVSYIEVYNENVYDLIKPSKTPLQLREDPNYGVMVAGLTINNIKTARELLNMLENGNKNRTQHPTDANAESSRSHAVFQVYIKMSNKTSNQVRIVKLSMIDLAGSERAAATGCVGARFKEGANINKSLLSLANCINKLADGSAYIPYRDSKLTRLLKDSLGGNCKTVMIANVSPSAVSYEDTYNTLKYASRASKIQLNIKKNIVDGDMRVSNLVKINEELKKRVKELEGKIATAGAQKESDSKLAQKVKELEAKLKAESDAAKLAKRKVKELEAKLTLTQHTAKEDIGNNSGMQEWRQRILEQEAVYSGTEGELLALMSRQRVLALRHWLRTRAFSRIADLAHRSSSEIMEQMCTEEIPRQERAAESYARNAVGLDAKIMSEWFKWNETKKKLVLLFNQALSEQPDLQDFVENVQSREETRLAEANSDLTLKLFKIALNEIVAFTEYMSDMPNLLKKLYLTLKGYDKVTPSLTQEYLDIMKKTKSAKGISWSDTDSITDPDFSFISILNLERPSAPHAIFDVPQSCKNGPTNSDSDTDTRTNFERPKLNLTPASIKAEIDSTVTDSDELNDLENRKPRPQSNKRKGTPIKMMNNETIIINDSFEISDTKSNSAKKVKKKLDTSYDVENFASLQVKDLNSTFDMMGNMEALKKRLNPEGTKMGPQAVQPAPVRKELTDRTNTMTRTVNFSNGNGARIAKPVAVGKAAPVRRPVTAAPALARGPGFGSSLSRDGTPLSRTVQDCRAKSNVTQKSVGFKAVRARERMQTHPYSRPTFNQRK